MSKVTKEMALDYHREGKPGKIEVVPTVPYSSMQDLALAYSPGVAYPCLEIEKNPADAYEYTNKGNLIAVISNGTAVLGLGDIGALAGKPVMEGRARLFRHRGQRERPEKIYRDCESAGSDIRRHKPRGYQSARMF